MLSSIAPPTLTLEEGTQRAHIFHRAVWAIVPIAVAFLTLVAINQPETLSRAAPAGVFVIFLGVVALRLNRRRTRLAAILFATGLMSLMTALAIISGGGMRSPGATMYFVIVLMTGLVLGQRAAAVTAVVCAILCFGLVLAERFGLLLPAIPYNSTTLWWLSCLYMSIVVVLMRLPDRWHERDPVRPVRVARAQANRTGTAGKAEAVTDHDRRDAGRRRDVRHSHALRRLQRTLAERLSTRQQRPQGIEPLRSLSRDRRRVEINTQEVHGRRTESREEDPFPRSDGTVDILRYVVRPWQKGSGEIGGILMLTEVITDRIRAQEEQRSLRDQLQQAQKMDALGTLASGIAHDFNNLLAIIVTNAESGCIETSNGRLARNCFEEIKNASSRANDLVRQILLFSRKQDSERKTISLLPIVTDALALLRATLPANVEFRTALGSAVPAVAANATQVYQILVNLGTNAGQAMPDGGVLSVSLDHIHTGKGEAATCGELREGEYVRISIQDTGIGMTRATIDRVFEPFFTTRGIEGIGLGLSIVHRLVKDHDGAITIASEVGKGSTFRVYFPVVSADATDSSLSLPDGAARLHGEHILYIDDEERLTHALKRLLSILGYRCTVYSDPEIAVNAFRANPDQFDAVIADITMRGLSGIDVAKELRAVRPAIPIALTSGMTSQETLNLASSLGCNVWLSKPATVDQLCHTLDLLLRKRIVDSGRTD